MKMGNLIFIVGLNVLRSTILKMPTNLISNQMMELLLIMVTTRGAGAIRQ